ncbi:MAG TPA: hypothetical protein VHN39_00565 [Phenylobacterium sp.]|jgi:hypothetical protein|nr:hypothetical protein [Phenylobacterium sp.]
MAMYTFYLCNLGGGSSSFESFNLGSDADAPARALKMLAEHPSCAYVAVWSGERPVLEHHREAVIFQAPNRPAVVAAPQHSS